MKKNRDWSVVLMTMRHVDRWPRKLKFKEAKNAQATRCRLLRLYGHHLRGITVTTKKNWIVFNRE